MNGHMRTPAVAAERAARGGDTSTARIAATVLLLLLSGVLRPLINQLVKLRLQGCVYKRVVCIVCIVMKCLQGCVCEVCTLVSIALWRGIINYTACYAKSAPAYIRVFTHMLLKRLISIVRKHQESIHPHQGIRYLIRCSRPYLSRFSH